MYIKFKKDTKRIEYKDGDERNEISDSLDGFDDAGYILNDNEIVVDLDDLTQEQVRIFMKTFDIHTQSVWSNPDEQNSHHGVHLYFKKPAGFNRASGVCMAGFNVEYKTTPKNKYVTVKRHGVARKVENMGVREEMPECLMPKDKGHFKNMMGLAESEGRNNHLFNHKVNILRYPKWRLVLKFINEHLFDEPLPESEMDLLLREQDIVATKDNQYDMATHIMRDLNVVFFGTKLFFRHGDKYISNENVLYRLIWRRCKGMNNNYVNEIMNQLETRSPIIPNDTIFPIKFKNGILKNGEFIRMNYTDFTPYTIDIDYDPDTEPVKEVDDYINHLTNGDEKYKLFLGEVFGHILIKDPHMKAIVPHIFFFVGTGGNGKGTFLKVVQEIIGKENCSSSSIQELTDEKYLNNLNNKLVNLGDDIKDKAIDNDEIKILKNLSSCDTIAMREMYKNAEPVTPTLTMIFTTNHVVKSWEKGESVYRRFMWCPMYTKVKKRDPKFVPSITTHEAIKYWVKLAVEGYLRIYQNGKMTENDPVNNENINYKIENNLSQMFIEGLTFDQDVNEVKPKDLYDRYTNWCEVEGIEPTSQKIFKQNIMDTFNVVYKQKKINGDNHRVYIREEIEEGDKKLKGVADET